VGETPSMSTSTSMPTNVGASTAADGLLFFHYFTMQMILSSGYTFPVAALLQ